MNPKILRGASVLNCAALLFIYANGFRKNQLTHKTATISHMCRDNQNQAVVLTVFLFTAIAVAAQTVSLLPMMIFFATQQCFRYHERTTVHKSWAAVSLVFVLLSLKKVMDITSAPLSIMYPHLPVLVAIGASFWKRNSASMGVAEVAFLLLTASMVSDCLL